jgi:hypothetical protein
MKLLSVCRDLARGNVLENSLVLWRHHPHAQVFFSHKKKRRKFYGAIWQALRQWYAYDINGVGTKCWLTGCLTYCWRAGWLVTLLAVEGLVGWLLYLLLTGWLAGYLTCCWRAGWLVTLLAADELFGWLSHLRLKGWLACCLTCCCRLAGWLPYLLLTGYLAGCLTCSWRAGWLVTLLAIDGLVALLAVDGLVGWLTLLTGRLTAARTYCLTE